MNLRKYYGRIGCLVFLLAIAPFWYLAGKTGAGKAMRSWKAARQEGFEKVEEMIRQGKAEAKIIESNHIEFSVHFEHSWGPGEGMDEVPTPEGMLGWVGDWADLKEFCYPLPCPSSVVPGSYKRNDLRLSQTKIIRGELDFRRVVTSPSVRLVPQKRIDRAMDASTLPSLKIFRDENSPDRLVVESHCRDDAPVGLLIRNCHYEASMRLFDCFRPDLDFDQIEEEYTLRLHLVVSPV